MAGRFALDWLLPSARLLTTPERRNPQSLQALGVSGDHPVRANGANLEEEYPKDLALEGGR